MKTFCNSSCDFQIFVESNKQVINRAKDFFEENLNTVKSKLPEMGLADMDLFTWNDFDDESQEAKPGIITRGAMETSSHSLSSISNISTEDAVAPPPRCLKRGKKVRVKEASENKITALEDELANLRSQIAMIVSLQEKGESEHPCCNGYQGMAIIKEYVNAVFIIITNPKKGHLQHPLQ